MKTLWLLLCSLALPAAAQQAAETPDLLPGRLFLSPEKRHLLDRQRQHNVRVSEDAESASLQLNGIVQRSSGRHTSWINQRMQHDGDTGPVSVRVERTAPGQATVSASDDTPVQLRVGESLNRDTRERQDVVAPNAIRAGKPRQESAP